MILRNKDFGFIRYLPRSPWGYLYKNLNKAEYKIGVKTEY